MAPCVPVKSILFFKKTNVNKTHQLIPGIGTAIFGVMEPHLATPKFAGTKRPAIVAYLREASYRLFL